MVYKMVKPLASQFSQPIYNPLAINTKPWVEAHDLPQKVIKTLGRHVLCPRSHHERLGEVLGIHSFQPGL
jgi:hypothetical protein